FTRQVRGGAGFPPKYGGRPFMSQQQTQQLESFVEPDTYLDWQKAEGVRVITEYAFEDLCDVELSPWPRKGGAGVIINIPYPKLWSDSHLIEIRPGGSSAPERHMYAEAVYI